MLKSGVILFFDVNGTIIAHDQAQDKTVETKILQELTKKHQINNYASTKNLLSLREFSFNLGARDKFQRYNYLLDYLAYLEHPQIPLIKEEYLSLHAQVKAQSGHIFNSFYTLVKWLDRQHIPYTLVLRSFGSDIPVVIKELAQQGIAVVQQGAFVGKSLHLEGRILDTPEAIMNNLKLGQHAAWRDDYGYWHTHHHARNFAKPFFVDDRRPRVRVPSLPPLIKLPFLFEY